MSPALLSADGVIPKVAFGVAIPVIIISGAINSTVVGRYILDREFANSSIRYVNTAKGWCAWVALIAGITVVGWLIAEAIPFFPDLLGVISALFISGFSFYFPAMFWFTLLRHVRQRRATLRSGGLGGRTGVASLLFTNSSILSIIACFSLCSRFVPPFAILCFWRPIAGNCLLASQYTPPLPSLPRIRKTERKRNVHPP